MFMYLTIILLIISIIFIYSWFKEVMLNKCLAEKIIYLESCLSSYDNIKEQIKLLVDEDAK